MLVLSSFCICFLLQSSAHSLEEYLLLVLSYTWEIEAWVGDSSSLASNILLEKEKEDGGLDAWVLLSDSEAHVWM